RRPSKRARPSARGVIRLKIPVTGEGIKGIQKFGPQVDEITEVTVLKRGEAFCRDAGISRADQDSRGQEVVGQNLELMIRKKGPPTRGQEIGRRFCGPSVVDRNLHWKFSVVIMGEGVKTGADLFQVILAEDSFRAFLCLAE